MKKVFGKILTFALAFVMLFSLVACEKEKDPKQVALDTAISKFIINGLDAVVSNKSLPETVGDYTIEWTVSQSEFAFISQTRDGAPVLQVTSPTIEEGGKNIILTATIKDGEFSAKKDFEVFLRAVEQTPISSCADVITKNTAGDSVCVKGTVIMIVENKGLWVKDDTAAVYVYVNGAVGDIVEGDIVTVNGKKDVYYSLTEIITPTITVNSFFVGTYNPVAFATDADISELLTFDSRSDTADKTRFGKLFNVEGIITDAPSGTYTYALKNYKNSDAIVLYDSSMGKGVKDKIASLKDKYVKMTVILWDCHSSNYFRFVPFGQTIVEAKAPEVSAEEIVASGEAIVKSLAGDVYNNLTLPTEIKGFEGKATITWASSNPAVLGNDGNIGTSTNFSENVTLTATITSGSVTKDVVIECTVHFMTVSTIAQVNELIDNGETKTVWIEAKIIGFDKNNEKPFLADETGVIFSYAKVKKGDFQVGDVVKVVGEAKLYNEDGKKYIRQIASISSIEVINKAIKVIEPVKINLSDIVDKKVAEGKPYDEATLAMLKETSLYGGLYEITGYVIEVPSGNYMNYYLAADTKEGTANVLYYYNNALQTEFASYAGKEVTIIAPMYEFSSKYGWEIGTYTSITTGSGSEKTEPTHTIAQVREFAVDKAPAVDVVLYGQVTSVFAGSGFYLEDETAAIFVYVKGDTSNIKVGNYVTVTGKSGYYNGSQITSPVVKTELVGQYTPNPSILTVDEFIGLDNVADNYGREITLTAKLFKSDKYINIELKAADGTNKAVTSNLNLTSDQMAKLTPYIDQIVTLNVVTYNRNPKYPFSVYLLNEEVIVPAE